MAEPHYLLDVLSKLIFKRLLIPLIGDSSMMFVITVSRHDLDDHKNKNGVATDLFCTGVIGHPGHILKLGTEVSNKKRHDWSTKLV